ncbi:hypothetical protein DRP05_08020 [Archaeoglobales archaeon]|nr:MAG: hypothetical protein DRP05_08020 [Archaeoglobales archaeon]
MGRHSVFLDSRTETKLDFLLSKENTTKSELLRKAIALYYEIFCIDYPVDLEKIKTYAMLLCKGEHLIVDVAHWELFMSLSDHFDNIFWEELHKIGKEHGEQWRNKVDFFGFLELLEFCNWFSVIRMDEKSTFWFPRQRIVWILLPDSLRELLADTNYPSGYQN